MTSDEASAVWALQALPGLGVRRIALLIEAFGSASAAVDAGGAARAAALSLGRLGGEADLAEAAAALARIRAQGIGVIALGEPGYPPALGAIYDPPGLLFVRGDPAALARPCLAVVGPRRASDFALDFAADLARSLAAAGVCVVSGLALGVDGAAHRGALTAGITAAVLGGGVDRVAPRSHAALAAAIVAAGGALVSEYPPGSALRPGNFVARNRIVSGLAAGVVVVEAGASSGALLTSEFALEQGRTVFAVPTRPGSANSAGTLALLRDGAVPIGSAEQVIGELGWSIAAGEPATPAPPLPPAEAAVMAALAESGALTLDDLERSCAISSGALRSAVGRLELAGALRRTASGRLTTSTGSDRRAER